MGLRWIVFAALSVAAAGPGPAMSYEEWSAKHQSESTEERAKKYLVRQRSSTRTVIQVHQHTRYQRPRPVLRSNGTCDMNLWNKAIISRKVLGGRPKYASCAVVGSSGRLVGQNLGSEIDNHEFVVRHNSAPTVGFEQDVGGKTSMMIQSSGALKHLQNDDKRGNFKCPTMRIFYTARKRPLKQWLSHRCQNETDVQNDFIDIRKNKFFLTSFS